MAILQPNTACYSMKQIYMSTGCVRGVARRNKTLAGSSVKALCMAKPLEVESLVLEAHLQSLIWESVLV